MGLARQILCADGARYTLFLLWISTCSKLIRSILIKQLYQESGGPLPPPHLQSTLVDPAGIRAGDALHLSIYRLAVFSIVPHAVWRQSPPLQNTALETWKNYSVGAIYTGLFRSGAAAVIGRIISLSSGRPGELGLQTQPLPSSVPGAPPPPRVIARNISRCCQVSPGEQVCPMFENHWSSRGNSRESALKGLRICSDRWTGRVCRGRRAEDPGGEKRLRPRSLITLPHDSNSSQSFLLSSFLRTIFLRSQVTHSTH